MAPTKKKRTRTKGVQAPDSATPSPPAPRRDRPATSSAATEAASQADHTGPDAAAPREDVEVTAGNLETAKEGLQAVNERLMTVNHELRNKVEELDQARSDLANLVDASDLSALFLDRRLCIKRFTPAAGRLLNLVDEDVGRSFRDFASQFEDDDLPGDAEQVIDSSSPKQKVVRGEEERWYLRRIVPNRSGDRIDGAVITFADITVQRALQAEVIGIATSEQRRIGQELHDSTQQELTGLGLLAQNLSMALGPTEEGELAAKLAAGIAEAHRNVRALARGLVPVPIGAGGLESALRELALATENRYGVACRPGPFASLNTVDDLVATHLYRIAQEAITNAVRHASPKTITVRIGDREGMVELVVEDDGNGIDEHGGDEAGIGLNVMRQRCELIGGKFSVRSGNGGGTVVRCAVPPTPEASPPAGRPA
jgi:signal transduction histidine kinase